jgi:hypothetical protein
MYKYLVMQATRLLRTLLFVLIIFCSLNVAAQVSNKPILTSSVPAPLNPVLPVPTQYANGIVTNSVKVKTAKGKYTDVNTFNAQNYQHVNETIDYVDGLGRPLQTVMRETSPSGSPKDIVQPHIYDPLGRETVQYLPYQSNSSNGTLKTNAFIEQQSYLQSIYSGEQVFYGLTEYDKSPLATTVKSMAPGNSWAGSGKGVINRKTVNISDNVVKWEVDAMGTYFGGATFIPPFEISGYYPQKTLYKNIIIDERGNRNLEYKDKNNKVILKKVQIDDIVDDGDFVGWLCTYYVYDEMDRLVLVIPPKAFAASKGFVQSWEFEISNEIKNELCFYYKYDNRGRLIVKKIPGAAEVHMVYDNRDRLVFVQDGNMRFPGQGMQSQKKWMATVYDDMNRPVITGIVFSQLDRQALQDYVNGLSGGNSNYTAEGENSSALAPTLSLSLRETGKPIYRASDYIEFLDGFVSEANAEFTAEISNQSSGGNFSNTLQIHNNPVPLDATLIPLTYAYYDNYQWTNKQYDANYAAKLDPGTNLHAETLPTAAEWAQVNNKTLVTGTRVKLLDGNEFGSGNKWLSSVNFYEEDGRLIQVQKTNLKGGEEVITNLYDFSGRILSTYHEHNNIVADISNVRINTNYNYDYEGRLLEVWKTINDDVSKKILISRNTYDGTGQLLTKELGRKKDNAGVYTNVPLETLNYSYNIRGWLNGINKDYANNTGSGQTASWFGMELDYDWGFQKNQLNGNIAGTKWRSRGDNMQRSYGFTYDNANRIMSSDFNQLNSAWDKSAGIDFSSVMGDGVDPFSAYDENGNILAMRQWGLKGTSSSIVDDLVYTYNVKSNKLQNVIDGVNDPNTKLGDFRSSTRYLTSYGIKDINSIDYLYDQNGNLIQDLNKDLEIINAPDGLIGAIIYNHLNLPSAINVNADQGSGGQKGNIYYIYDASGSKLEKRVHENPAPANNHTQKNTTTTYLGEFVYENDGIKFFSHEEGRARWVQKLPQNPGSWEYDF